MMGPKATRTDENWLSDEMREYLSGQVAEATTVEPPVASVDGMVVRAYTGDIYAYRMTGPEWTAVYQPQFGVEQCMLYLVCTIDGDPPEAVPIARETFRMLSDNWTACMDLMRGGYVREEAA